ncbi:hypothetical protein C7C46_10335 [Streptomyces tateyamensis]|uniref:Resolvase/invertase-type recombinase catalytic domain-containing protein n=1 Tax=Streptomyces tateyamensis TaxID=565073 RepID=A0A2V4NFW2_9ACTN|nr:recombinase family protein [Streptomyces tateyamensis]PYC82735.1 hypothetical protein C7C46_10335 [Streptomyces tateyamensis]
MSNSTLPGRRVASRVAARQKAGLSVRIAVYLRVSTRNQVEGSGLDQQEKDARAWIECWFRDMPFEIVGIFVDDGISGKIDNRRDQVKLKTVITAGEVDLVISQRIDRFGRTMRDIQRWVWEMNDLGLRVVTADGRIDSEHEIADLLLMCHKNKLSDRVREKSLARPHRELMALQASLQEAQAWLKDCEATQQEAKEREEFISSARLRVGSLTLAEKSALFAMFDVRVSAGNHRFRKRSGRPCPVTEWHKGTQHPVPADIDEEDWAGVREILAGYVAKSSFTKTTIDLRLAFNGMFYRLRTGTPWNEMTDAFGNPQRIRERQLTFFQRGAWQAVVEMLNQRGGGTPVYVAPTVPPLKITSCAGAAF